MMLRAAGRLCVGAMTTLLLSLPGLALGAPAGTNVPRPSGGQKASSARPLPPPAHAPPPAPLSGAHAPTPEGPRLDAKGRPMLTLATINRTDSITVPALSDEGGFDAEDLDRVAVLLRASNGDIHPIDSRTLSILYRIQVHFGVGEIRVLSAYRTPKPGNGSNHGKGRAIDFVVPGIPDEQVARFAREIGFVGVGIYPTSRFLHVDIRPRSYFWMDSSAPGKPNRERAILGDVAKRSDEEARARGQRPAEPFGSTKSVDELLREHALREDTVPNGDDDDED